jgi:hypothetical protein
MKYEIEEKVLSFYYHLFDSIFCEQFRPKIESPLKRDAVARQIRECAAAASQTLTRLFVNERVGILQVGEILAGLEDLGKILKFEQIRRPNVSAESITKELLPSLPCPPQIIESDLDVVYRLTITITVQALLLVGPVMAKWQEVNFATTFELPRRAVEQLNRITDQIELQHGTGPTAEDERFELTYRDYLLQRFFQVEAGTIQMTTNLGVDLRELFVMPNVGSRLITQQKKTSRKARKDALMDLAAARKIFLGEEEDDDSGEKPKRKRKPKSALDYVRKNRRTVLVGLPGAGKSTFLEWLQLMVAFASVEEPFVLADNQAIPLMLRVRELDPANLPASVELIEKATRSPDHARIMPRGWIERQMKGGRVIFMLDGLDEVEPRDRDRRVIPWLMGLVKDYPDCGYVVSSRPVGYPVGMLRKEGFTECDLMDFEKDQVEQYTRHWCTAIRLARNEPRDEAYREGKKEGAHIAKSFRDHPFIRNLARNPLMLSAICLVNYFERGHLPEDRALLYKLCVEGLIHYWDERRGIHSDFGLQEKIQACREVAITVQNEDKAEYEAEKVLNVFRKVLDDEVRAKSLLEHIRYRTGLLLERRPGVFAFAHLTFQEYLAARAVHEGNKLGITPQTLVKEYNKARWEEVIPLYCGIVPPPAARGMLENLAACKGNGSLCRLLAEAYFTSGSELTIDSETRRLVVSRIARKAYVVERPFHLGYALDRFKPEQIAPIVNDCVATCRDDLSHAFRWLQEHGKFVDPARLFEKMKVRKELTPYQLTEIVYLLHRFGTDDVLLKTAACEGIYLSKAVEEYNTQAVIAFLGLAYRSKAPSRAIVQVLIKILSALAETQGGRTIYNYMPHPTGFLKLHHRFPSATRELAYLVRKIIRRSRTKPTSWWTRWLSDLEHTAAKRKKPKSAKKKAKTTTKKALKTKIKKKKESAKTNSKKEVVKRKK